MSTSRPGFINLNGFRQFLQSELPEFSGAQRRLALYILQHAAELPMLTTTALAQAAGTSQSTVTRFASRLGFSSYAAFTDALGRMVLDELHMNIPLERFRHSEGNGGLASLINQEILHLRSLQSLVETKAFHRSVELLTQSRSVLVAGCAASTSLAVHTHLYLSRLRPQVQCATEFNASLFTQAVHYSAGDCALLFSVPRMTGDLARMLGLLQQRDVQVILVTDPSGLIFTEGVTETLVVPVSNTPTTAVPASMMMLASLLIDATALRLPEDSLRNLQRFEGLAKAGNLFVANDPAVRPGWTDPTRHPEEVLSH
ncbi:MurR/RpiR family transcriptional regulator [Deinococcus deserti]|uniref:Putative transcriptional regulator, RpiR family n=1 Tax=Deinococcus deserti (strain DSM 17065 / CIP 109153 / LMG 22923 / VCD115) TaxID=546414 RepID=C1D3U9_DEIDV|nr:MurR/RpiR family transcriptional regulator [Deinococcus deserti]ACO48178.1 putative transcriptional regulator, RpiR family [Deinococcus deserti VCD115]